MDKTYDQTKVEEKWYKFWEDNGLFKPEVNPNKEPFTILLPLPNANDPMHIGHAMFTIQDIMIRQHRMLGQPTLWLPGGDHAGIETQYVFEKKLSQEGKSRFDFDRETLYQMIAEYVEKNKNINREQLKKLGFSLDWSRYHYSLEPEIVKTILGTFRKLHQDGLVYRGERIVNYCTHCGTSFSDLEVDFKEKDDFLYFLDYGSIQIATTRPETIFADAAVAVNSKDKHYKNLVGKMAIIPLINKEIPIIGDEKVETDFGTGALKITPAHDATDFEIGQRHKLPVITVLDREGHIINTPKGYLGLTVSKAREKVIADLEKAGKLVKTEPLKHSVGVCYRCKSIIEPMVLAQWFIKTKPLAKPAIEAVKKGRTKIVPLKRFEKLYFDWMENIKDWNISRQIVWGPRIPAWYKVDGNEQRISVNFIDNSGEQFHATIDQVLSGRLLNKNKKKVLFTLKQIKEGLQQIIVPIYTGNNEVEFIISEEEPRDGNWIQETDTFDTWFLSGQWPLTTLGYPNKPDFKYFYPTAVLDTLWDILFFWVARMMMFGLYLTNDVPFKVIHLHSRVVDKAGQKMSKSKGNVIDPIEMVEKYGADALRISLVYGVAPGSDIHVLEDKIRAMRNFTNKLWNIGRFIVDFKPEGVLSLKPNTLPQSFSTEDEMILEKLKEVTKIVNKALGCYRFNDASERLYEFIWHEFADKYIESTKDRRAEAQPTLEYVLKTSLELLHPFMPFITEEIWQKLPHKEKSIMIASWPK